MRQLGGLDASFLYMETPQTPMHVGGLYLFELPPGYEGDFYDDFKAHIARRLHLAPILSKKLSPMPLELDHPVWVEAGEVDLDYHVRRLGLPRPGTLERLEELVGRLHSNFLDRSRPLWEFYIIDGLQSGHAVLYTKVHHAAIDGGAGMELMRAIYDLTPQPREVEPPQPRAAAAPGRQPDLMSLLGTAYTSYLRQQVRTLQAIPDAWKALARAVLPDAQTLRYQPFSPPPLVAPKTILNGTITSQRAFAARSVPLDNAKRIARHTGAKLNDVVLAACSGALRRYLQDRDALPAQPLTAFVPVSLREAGNTEANNQVFGMICSLATDVAEPATRLRAIMESSQQAKQLTGNIKDVVPRDYQILGAPLLLQGLMGLYSRSGLADQAPLAANVTISNVPGPTVPLYAAGAKMLTMYPVSIPSHGVALNITVQSYNGALDFGLTTCRRILPDVRLLADYVVDAMDELKAATERARAAEPAPVTVQHGAADGATRPAAGQTRRKALPVPAQTTPGTLPVDAAPLMTVGQSDDTQQAAAPARRQTAKQSRSDDAAHEAALPRKRAVRRSPAPSEAAHKTAHEAAPTHRRTATRSPAPNEATHEAEPARRRTASTRTQPPAGAPGKAAQPRKQLPSKPSPRSSRARA